MKQSGIQDSLVALVKLTMALEDTMILRINKRMIRTNEICLLSFNPFDEIWRKTINFAIVLKICFLLTILKWCNDDRRIMWEELKASHPRRTKNGNLDNKCKFDWLTCYHVVFVSLYFFATSRLYRRTFQRSWSVMITKIMEKQSSFY